MKEILLQILQAVLIIGLPLVSTYIIKYIKNIKAAIEDKVDNNITKDLLEQALDAVAKAVAFVMQTYVDELKKSGSFNLANKQEALRMAKEAAMSIMSQDSIDLITSMYGNFESWLTIQIESQVIEQKYAPRSVTTPLST